MRQKKAHTLTHSLRRFLDQPRIARLATIDPDGYPHVVPMYFLRKGDEILFGSDRDERKVRNALANSRGAVVIGGDPDRDEAGYLIRGDLSVEADADHAFLSKMFDRYETGPEAEQHRAEWAEADIVVIHLRPKRVVRVW